MNQKDFAFGGPHTYHTYLHHREVPAEHEDDAHLKEKAQRVSDVVASELFEALRAVSSLEKESPAGRSFPELGLQGADLACKHERRAIGKDVQRIG
jgi:hypothetical protein